VVAISEREPERGRGEATGWNTEAGPHTLHLNIQPVPADDHPVSRTPVRRKPGFIPPMTAHVVNRLPEGEDWIYEFKFDGYRALVVKNGRDVTIRSRNDKNLTSTYPSVAAAGLRLRADEAIVDGEIVALD
jgi:ATP-dependent DNA ligase